MKREYHILNFGCGVQSTAVALMVQDGEIRIPTASGMFEAAVFADTQEEPSAVYRHLEWMRGQLSYPLVVRTAGKLGDDLSRGENSTGQRFASIPAFTASEEGNATGMIRRQCTKEYKVEVIERWIRRELLGLKPRQRIPCDVQIVQYMCFSCDEPGRAANARNRFAQLRWGRVEFPLFADDLWMSRGDCQRYNERRVPHVVPRSACGCCPFRSNQEWRDMKRDDPEAFARAVEIDRASAFRDESSIVDWTRSYTCIVGACHWRRSTSTTSNRRCSTWSAREVADCDREVRVRHGRRGMSDKMPDETYRLMAGELSRAEWLAVASSAALALIRAAKKADFDPRFILNTALALKSKAASESSGDIE